MTIEYYGKENRNARLTKCPFCDEPFDFSGGGHGMGRVAHIRKCPELRGGGDE